MIINKLKILAVIIMLSFNYNVICQDFNLENWLHQNGVDSSMMVKLDSFELIDSSLSIYNNKHIKNFQKEITNLKNIRDLKLLQLQNSTDLSTQSFYNSLESDSSYSTTQLYNEFRLSQALDVLKIPININANLLLEDGSLNKKVSGFSVTFNRNKKLDQLKNKKFELPSAKEVLQIEKDNLLNNLEKEYLNKDFKNVIYQSILNTLNIKLNEATEKDKEELLEIRNEIRDDYYKNLLYFNELPKDVESGLSKKLDQIIDHYVKVENTEILADSLLAEKEKISTKILASTTQFGIGRVFLDDDNIAVKNLSLNGINYRFKYKNLHGGISYGNKSYDLKFIPSIQSLLTKNYNGTNVLLFQIGQTFKDSTVLEANFIKAKENSNLSDSLNHNSSAYRSLIYDLKGRTKIANNYYLFGEFSVTNNTSNANFSSSIPIETNPTGNFAFNYGIELEEKKFLLSLAYFYHGPSYSSLTNPILFTNRQGLSIKSSLKLFKDKIQLNGGLEVGKEISKEIVEKNRSFNLNLSSAFIFGKANLLSVVVSPNFYNIEFGEFNSSNIQSSIYFASLLLNSKITNSLSAVTNISVSNFNSTYRLTDTLNVANEINVQFDESLNLDLKNSIVFNGRVKLDNEFNEINEYDLRLGHKVRNKTFDFTYGLESAKRVYLGEKSLYGFNGSLNYKSKNNVRFNFSLSYLHRFVEGTHPLVNANVGLNYLITYKNNYED